MMPTATRHPRTLPFLCLLPLLAASAAAQQNPAGLARPGTARVADVFTPLPAGSVRLAGGMLGDRFAASERKRLLAVNEDELLDAFERRDVPHQDWQGEHAGKFLHAATLAWKATGDPALKAKMDRVARRLMATQEADGYLGTYPKAQRWTSWDVWCHKYDLIGLLTYYQYTHDEKALAVSRRIGDLLIRTFGDGPGQLDINKAGLHEGMAPDSVIEPIVLLYRATNDPRYRDFAAYIVRHYDAPGGPRILTTLEKERAVNKVANAKAYEMLSNLNGVLELYRATGNARLLRDARIAWDDVAKNRLYITGSASAGEFFRANYELPNGEGDKLCETCVTVTWEQMNLQLLRLTGDPRFADALERTVYNHLLAAQKPTGDQWSYYTPLEGRKPYSNATSCCVSSGPRGIALIPSIATMTSEDGGLVVNLYTPGTASARLKTGTVTLTQATDFPRSGKVVLTVSPAKAARFPLRLRIPAWASGATVSVNGKAIPAARVKPGTYAVLDRTWKKGDRVALEMPMAARVVRGNHGNDGKMAVLYGPLVLALDTAYNPGIRMLKQVALAADDAKALRVSPAPQRSISGEMVFATTGSIASGPVAPLYLTPYATAGQDALSRFAVWVARPGRASVDSGSGSLFYAGRVAASRRGNAEGDIADDDLTTYTVTWDLSKPAEDWYTVTLEKPVRIARAVYAHGRTFHDGGWFDTSGGTDMPRLQVQKAPGGPWTDVAAFTTYPPTTATDNQGLTDGQSFSATFPPVTAIAIRVIGKPACGDDPKQAFSSCAELEAFDH